MPVSGNGTAVRGLGGAAGFGEIPVPRGDDNALQLDIRAIFGSGLLFGDTRHGADTLWVNTNGTLSFGAAFSDIPETGNTAAARDLIAPYWGDADTRLDGELPESGGIWVDLDPAQGTVTVTWDRVGVYRRNAEATATFQVQLFNRGNGDLDIAFRYEDLGWHSGTAPADTGARAGLAGPSLPDPLWIAPEGGAEAMTALPGILGNTGAPGLWVYRLSGGAVEAFGNGGLSAQGSAGNDTLAGSDFADILDGLHGNDVIRGGAGNDTLGGGEGADTLDGGAGADHLYGGFSPADLRDVIYAGAGDDLVEAGAGNDDVFGQDGNDTLAGQTGADTLRGQGGQDALSGAALGDVLFGGDGDDFLNGGFGFDRLNGGDGADRFYHLGAAGHGSDWIQDYVAVQGDVLAYGGDATAGQFQINIAETANAGRAGVAEAFIIHRPTGQIIWALVDGSAQGEILLGTGGITYDLLA